MAFLSQFINPEDVAKLSDRQVEELAEHAQFAMDREATSNPQLKAAIEKAVKPYAKALVARADR